MDNFNSLVQSTDDERDDATQKYKIIEPYINRVLSKIFQAVKAILFLGVVKLQVHKTASKQGSLPYFPSVLF